MNRKQKALICAVTGTAFLLSSVLGGAASVQAFTSGQASETAEGKNTKGGNPASPGNADEEGDHDIDKNSGGDAGNNLRPQPATPSDALPDVPPKPGLPDDTHHKTESEQEPADDIIHVPIPSPIPVPATPSETAPEELFSPLSGQQELEYTLCSYYFFYNSHPALIEPGDGIEAFEWGVNPVEVYLDGPDGHLDDSFYVDVDWDFSEVDFGREGTYTITGTFEPDLIDCPVDWDNAAPPSFILQIVKRRILSFQPEVSGNTLTLHYLMEGEPYRLPDMAMELYESVDDGENWSNITRTNRVKISDDRLVISGVSGDCLFQAVDLHLENLDYSCSDLVRITGENDLKAELISSDGKMGGDSWNEGNWDTTPIEEGPYQVLGYGTSPRNIQPLHTLMLKGEPEQEQIEFFNQIFAFYGDRQGLWKNSVRLDVDWDRQALEHIDWNQTGDTFIRGQFSEESISKYSGLLDFSSMPELTLKITIYEQFPSFVIVPKEEKLYENNRVEFLFENDNLDPVYFPDTSELTVWCCDNANLDWYNITNAPNVTVNNHFLSISGLKQEILRNGTGYTFQVEQNSRSDLNPFSVGINVSHGIWGLSFSQTVDGERGGGKRHNKAPEGLFDGSGPDEGEPSPTPPEPDNPPAPPEPDSGWETDPDGNHGSSSDSGGGSSSSGSSNSSNGDSYNPSDENNRSSIEADVDDGSRYLPDGVSDSAGRYNEPPHASDTDGSPVSAANSDAASHLSPVPDGSMTGGLTEPGTEPGAGTDASGIPDGTTAAAIAAGGNDAACRESGINSTAKEDSSGNVTAKSRKLPPGFLRAAAGLAAVVSGSAIGFFMIRRR
ncbi:hypothetical protein [Clostridium transplantifaecale]|uniref:hypothetical protein n=1 Tax=Clostridium transplantifaecale TaxID=2479838 RepID=UPI000F641E87|nr:hypothetical protein [Clostridium transplantifaecale]